MKVSQKLYSMPEFQELNRLPMHGAEIHFPDHKTALAGVWKK